MNLPLLTESRLQKRLPFWHTKDTDAESGSAPSHQGEPCQVGWTQKETGCVPKQPNDGADTATSATTPAPPTIATTPQRLAREQAVLAEAETVNFTDEVIPDVDDSRGNITEDDYDAIENEMSRVEQRAMERELDAIRDSNIDDAMVDYEPEIDLRDIAIDEHYDYDDIADAVRDLIDEHVADDVADASSDVTINAKLKNIIDDWEGTARNNQRRFATYGQNAVNALHALLKAANAPDALLDAVDEYADTVGQELDEAYERAIESDTDSYREMLQQEYDFNEDRERYLREFYNNNLERFSVTDTDNVLTDTWGTGSGFNYTYKFKGPGGIFSIDVDKTRRDPLVTQHGFNMYYIQFSNPDGSYSVTGKGGAKGALDVFANVTKAIVAFVKHHDADGITFTAAEVSRCRLYDRLVKTIAKVMPEYAAVASSKMSHKTYVVGKRNVIAKAMELAAEKKVELDTLVKSLDYRWKSVTAEINDAWWTKSAWQPLLPTKRLGKRLPARVLFQKSLPVWLRKSVNTAQPQPMNDTAQQQPIGNNAPQPESSDNVDINAVAQEFGKMIMEGWDEGGDAQTDDIQPENTKPQQQEPPKNAQGAPDLRKLADEFGDLLREELAKHEENQKALRGYRVKDAADMTTAGGKPKQDVRGKPCPPGYTPERDGCVKAERKPGEQQGSADSTAQQQPMGQQQNGQQPTQGQTQGAQQQTEDPVAQKEKLTKFSDIFTKLPKTIAAKAYNKVADVYGKLKERYGRGVAIAAVGAFLAGTALPVPGSSVLAMAPVIAAAEIYKKLTTAGTAEGGSPQETGAKIVDVAKRMAHVPAAMATKLRSAATAAFEALDAKYGKQVANAALGAYCAVEVAEPVMHAYHNIHEGLPPTHALAPSPLGINKPLVAAAELWHLLKGGHPEEPTTFAPPPPGQEITEPAGKQKAYTPDPTIIDEELGTALHARVGVPAMSVPPPPNEIPRLPNLTQDERKVESRFAHAYLKNPRKMIRDLMNRKNKVVGYDKNGKPMYDIGDGPNIFSTDDAKLLSKDYNPQGSDAQKKAAMGKYNAVVHQTANAIAKKAFLKYLDNLPDNKKTVLVTSGGCSSGKSYSLSSNPLTKGLVQAVGAVWDAAGEQNATENPWILEECRKRGIKAVFVYAHNDPNKTWAGARGVINRAKKVGRMVDARAFSDSYALGAKNFSGFYDKHKDDADTQFMFFDNTKESGPELMDTMPLGAMSVDADHLYQRASKAIDFEQNDVPEAVYYGGTIGRRVWGNPKQKQHSTH